MLGTRDFKINGYGKHEFSLSTTTSITSVFRNFSKLFHFLQVLGREGQGLSQTQGQEDASSVPRPRTSASWSRPRTFMLSLRTCQGQGLTSLKISDDKTASMPQSSNQEPASLQLLAESRALRHCPVRILKLQTRQHNFTFTNITTKTGIYTSSPKSGDAETLAVS